MTEVDNSRQRGILYIVVPCYNEEERSKHRREGFWTNFMS